MTILLYNRVLLQERTGKSFRGWKGCHIATYALAALFGTLNCYVLFTLCRLLGGRCPLDPHQLVFAAPRERVPPTTTPSHTETTTPLVEEWRDTGPAMLDLSESRFRAWGYCDMALSLPLLAAVVALVWTAMFCVCPGGGRSRRGLRQPWRVVTAALPCALVFAALTAHNLLATDSGLRAFCGHFHQYTNTSARCVSEMDARLPPSSPPPSALVSLCRAASAASCACWLVAVASLLARCLSGGDFHAHRTQVLLHPPKSQKPSPLRPRKRPDRRKIDLSASPSQPSNITSPGSAPSDSGAPWSAPSDSGAPWSAPSDSGAPSTLDGPTLNAVRFEDENNRQIIELH